MLRKKDVLRSPILVRIEELLVALMILLNLLNFFGLISGDLDFAKNIIGWSLLGYLLYRVSLTRLIFNNRNTQIDILIVLSYFLLIFKNIIAYIEINMPSFSFFYALNSMLVRNSRAIEFYAFSLGSILVAFISFYLALRMRIKTPSLMGILNEKGAPPKYTVRVLIRFMLIFLVLLGFFIIVFNLFMEWIIMAVHSQLVIAGFLFYIIVVLRHYRKFDVESLIFRIGSFGDRFYLRFISLFHNKKTLHLGISGMLVLHLLTDIGVFILPRLFQFRESAYFQQLGIKQSNIIALYSAQAANLGMAEGLSLAFIYVLNVFAILSLLSIPAVLWYVMFKNKGFRLKTSILGILLASLIVVGISPMFSIKALPQNQIVGVDIEINRAENYFFPTFLQVAALAMMTFLLFRIFAKHYSIAVLSIVLLCAMLFLGRYMILFFLSILNYYSESVTNFFLSEKYLLSGYFLILLSINVIFYAVGMFLFVYNIVKNRVYGRIKVAD